MKEPTFDTTAAHKYFAAFCFNQLGPRATEQENQWLSPGMWLGPAILTIILVGELIYVFALGANLVPTGGVVAPKQVGLTLFGPYLLGVELASMLLLSGLVGAYHLSQRDRPQS